MLGVRVTIVRYADDAQPGWVECQLVDAAGRVWTFHEKAPVVSPAALDASSVYPQPGVIACELVERVGAIARVDTARPWGVEAAGGETQFEVPVSAVVEC